MKWFKMQSDNLDDPFIQDLICEFGGNGYLIYVGIVSLICKENKTELTGKATFSGRYLKQKLHISQRKVEEILKFCEGKGKLFLNISQENSNISQKNFHFNFPKILEIKDNHSTNLQVTCKSLAPKNKSKEIEKETPKPPVENLRILFEEDWNRYPRKEGNKLAAEKSWMKSVGVNVEKRRSEFHKKMDEQIKAVSNKKYLLYASTFFNQWQDLSFDESVTKGFDPRELVL